MQDCSIAKCLLFINVYCQMFIWQYCQGSRLRATHARRNFKKLKCYPWIEKLRKLMEDNSPDSI